MIKCPVCGRGCDDAAAFCPECGVKLPHAAAGGNSSMDKPLGMWDFVLMELVAKVPIVNLVLYFVWGFSSGTNENRKNWSRSRLIWAAISLVISIIGFSLLAVGGRMLYDVAETIFHNL